MTSPNLLPQGFYVFDTPEEFFAAMFGPRQRDAHVAAYRWEMRLRDMEAASKRASQAGNDECARIIAEERDRQAQRIADDYRYNTAAIRAALHRWEFGCFSKEPFAKSRVHQLRRALDIAIEHQGALATAAE